ncbi:lantibiotic ABC transporter ATP-binding protein,Lipid A export ATP-binding/permease protein MsbA,cyclic beta-1,2-glucan ABC transporter,ABC-type bacteriocin/lantibiotic exporters, contain an N-terminal double-glycine peptidase domain,lipid A export permease/ATP-binding protein MsbA,ABC transporter (plasmid) [[Clostridium] sordellii]|uniref:ABC transporter ATP-binding protein n=1 Tax=Paraclostridium sordellii TaxID=1505 RepID=UPI00054081C8|nr:ABC transporter ATP-binding protein [Paeniclostridium sordellii]CEK32667.1 lantibiotic ABC transporter ATP-binding protein,Lipid A export ATP-binding/permease protein MsbA,cyclic beta-1,2-glucan ABC transporter,ABC-type bacteriocin/lantibiotic exporters, contain an N-terminal double-glycine peptidase domain,lipid A export permease/ATP-binding protein MsbA,ABC transporter (plasmid) [[Clostridium] sordellii] [Paeniclostridium sordellii]
MKTSTFNNIREIIVYTPKVFKILYSINKKQFIYMSILYLILGLVPSISILSTQWLINSIQISSGKTIGFVIMPLVIYLIVNFLSTLISGYSNYLQSNFRMNLAYNLQIKVLNKTKELEMKDFENPDIYDKLERIDESSSDRLFNSYTSIFSLIKQLITISTSAMILASWKIWIIVPIILISVISSIYMSVIGEKQYKVNIERSSDNRKLWYYKYLLTTDSAYKEIKLYNLQDYFLGLYRKIYINFLKQDKKLLKLSYIGTLVFSAIDQVIGGIICFLIIKAAFYGQILIGNTISYIRCISTLQSSIQGFLSIIVSIYQEGLYIRHIFDFLDLSRCKPSDNNKEYIDNVETIEFKDVSFKYPSRKSYSIENISFKVVKGDKVAIVGLNGSGKTTIVKLLCGFYDEYEGSILINNIEMRNIDKEALRESIAAIFQDFIKYELPLKENISLGNLKYLNNEVLVNSVLEKIGGDYFRNSLPNSIDTQLGVWFEEGVQLSGGQWQKISLMRAFYRDAGCYILDEPNSALDPISESEVFENICEITNDKIGFLITHRMVNINKFASKIIVLKNGKIIECGSHIELMNNKDHYYSLYTKQFANKSNEEWGIEFA